MRRPPDTVLNTTALVSLAAFVGLATWRPYATPPMRVTGSWVCPSKAPPTLTYEPDYDAWDSSMSACSVLPLFWVTQYAFRRAAAKWEKRVGSCAVCGYDLRATPDRCPECGAVPPPFPPPA